MPHLGAFVPSNYFAFIYVPVYKFRFGAFAPNRPLDAMGILVSEVAPPSDLSQALGQADVEMILAPACP